MRDMDLDTVLMGRAFVDGELTYAEIGISEGRIVAVAKDLRGGERRVDMGSSRIILPGFMDPHVHFRDPGMPSKEDFSTGSLAAVHAGVTCVLDMPNTKPPATDVATVMEKKSRIRGRSHVDYGVFAAVTPGVNARLLAPMVPGFKLFMGSTTGNILLNDDSELVPAVTDVLSTGKRMSVHAEDDSMMGHETEACTRDHLRNRPAAAEWNAIRRLADNFAGRDINICHITTSEGLDLARAAGFTTEVTLHHMMFDVDRCPGQVFKVNPPIRDIGCRDRLFSRFVSGDITMFGSDHAPHTMEEKAQEFDAAPGGMPGVETTMPVVMDLVRRDVVPLSLAVRMGAQAPSDAFGVRKGRIAAGYDADFAVFDMRGSSRIDVRSLHSRCGHSPFEGMQAVFPDTVIIRGEVQVHGREFCGERSGVDICG